MAHPSPIVLAALVACAVFAAPAPALAANRAVTGSGDWHDPSIWERGRIAGERDRATVERGDVDVRRNVEVRELKIGADGDTVRSSVSVRDGSSFSAWRSVVVGDSAAADAAFVVDDGTLETAELWLNSGSKRGPGSRAELSVSGTLRTSAIVANAGTASGTVVVTQSGDVEVSGSIDLSSGNGASSWVVDGGSLSWGGTLIAGGPSQRDSFIVRSAGAAVSDGACAFGTGASIGFVLEPGGVAPIVCHGGASLAADIAEFRIDGSVFAPGKGRLPLVAGGALSNAFDLSRAVVTGFDTNEYEVRVIEDGGRIVLDTRIDAATGAVVVDIVPQGPGYPDFGNRYDLDEFQFDVSNPHDEAVNLPLVFNKVPPTAITGSVMTLAEYDSRALTGIAVQIAKNWHGTSTSEVHRGSWIRGSTMIRLEPGETRRLVLRSVDGYWGATPAASHSHLSLVDYEGNWKWDQLALGAWGESMALDPTLHLAGSFVADFRPAFTLPMNGSSDHNWTENLGGADFLVYFDADNTYRWLKRVKTAYLWTGPNLTRVLYSGVTDDDRIRVTSEFRVGSTFDHLRAFHRFRYEFLDDVTDPARRTRSTAAGCRSTTTRSPRATVPPMSTAD